MGNSALAAQGFDLAEVLLLMIDAEGSLTLMNRKAQQVLGFASAELGGRDWLAAVVPPDRLEESRLTCQRVVSGEPPALETYENTMVTRSGDHRRMCWHFNPFHENGRVAGVVCTGVDITERINAQQQLDVFSAHLEELVEERTRELEKARDVARAADETKGRFLAQMGHELRTPLNAVLGFAQLLAVEAGLSTSAREKAVSILKSGERLRTLVGGALAVSRLAESDRAEVSQAPPTALPAFGPLPPEWTEAFQTALAEGNVTRLRQLGGQAGGFAPELGRWIVERTSHYELDELWRVLQDQRTEVNHG
jgi:PAS domain S-box-containing protein